MKKIFKRIDLLLIFVITFLTCSGCFKIAGDVPNSIGPVSLVTMPSTSKIRFMNEALYIGYLGAQRDFALLVDNAQYNYDHKTQGCGDNKEVGCASTLFKIIMGYGIKASHFNNVSSSDNLLIYYTTAADFAKYGDPENKNSWYGQLANYSSMDNSDFANNDAINYLSCGSKYNGTILNHADFCRYADELSNDGYARYVGDSMILLFNDGNLYDIIFDNDLDRSGKLNTSSGRDNLSINTNNEGLYEEYYNNLLSSLKGKINVSNATNDSSDVASDQMINNITTISDLKKLLAEEKDYLLLITSDGFTTDKIGTNKYYDDDFKEVDENTFNGTNNDDPLANTFSLLLNSISAYTDNCAVVGNGFLEFLKSVLRTYIAGGIGMGLGAGAGAIAGFLIGGILPGVGHLVGAAAGALIGALIGFFAGISVNSTLEKKLKSANGISNNNYCKIMESALTDIQINVPIYTYHIKNAKENIDAYRSSKMGDPDLADYYRKNESECLHQKLKVNIPSGLVSFFTDNLDPTYNYADECQSKLVSSIVGGFVGSPSLLLFLNGKKADDLYGRVTTELIMEMLYVWGLKTIGDLYNLAVTSTVDEMSVVFGSAQEITNAGYCISTSEMPNCDNKTIYPIQITNNNYVAATDLNDGIHLDFTNVYKEYSYNATINKFSDTVRHISDPVYLTFNVGEESGTGNLKYYLKSIDNDSWQSRTVLYHGDSSGAEYDQLNQIKEKVKTTLVNNINNNRNVFQIAYGNVNYIICEDNQVIGYIENGNGISVVYYCDGEENEYVFNGKYDTAPGEDEYYLYSMNTGSEKASVHSAHNFYIYIKYDITKYNEDGQDEGKETVYYAYVV